MAVPYTFGSATTSIPLSQLDSNFATTITLGNTAVQLGNTITSLTGISNVASATSLSLGSNGNTTAVTIDTSQNVGIGITSPTARLHLSTASGSTTMTMSTNNNQNANASLYNDATYFGIASNFGSTGVKVRFALNMPDSAMTVDSSGNLLVGTTSATYAANGIRLNPTQDGGLLSIGHPSGTATGTVFCGFAYNGSAIGSITQSGTTAVLFNVTSDERLKENIEDAESSSNLIDSLKVRKFDWKSDNSHQRYGFIAQELVNVVPEAVYQPVDIEQMMAVDYSKLVPMLVKEIQSLRIRFATLETKSDTQAETINALTARVVALESK